MSALAAPFDPVHLLGFDPASLATNRDGLMSGRQQSRLVWSAAWRLILAVLLVPTGLIIALFAWEFWTLAIPLLFVFAGLYLGWRGFSFCADAADGDVSVIDGDLIKHAQQTKNGTNYYVKLGPLSKGISKSTYFLLPGSIPCRGYYAPGSRAFLSLEPAGTPAPSPRRPFGPSSNTAWDRVRWSVLVALLAVPAILFGAHLYSNAQPAHFRALDGTISGYRETHGKSSSYYVSLNGAEFTLRTNPVNFTPSLTDLGQRIGTPATLYVRDQNDEVAAIRFNGDQLFETNIYADPGIQKSGMQLGGGLVALIGLALLIPAIWRLAGTPAPAAPVPKQDALHWDRSERGLVTIVGSTVALVLVIYAGIAAGWAWLQVGGDWGAWSLLGLAAAASAAAGRPIYRALRLRYSSGRLPLWSGLLASVVAPAVVLALGAGQVHSPLAVIGIAVVTVAFVAAASRMAGATKPA